MLNARVPWNQTTEPVRFTWDSSARLPNLLAVADVAAQDASGYVGSRAPGSDGRDPILLATGDTLTDWRLIADHPIRKKRGLLVLADPLAGLPSTPRGLQQAATAALTARRYARRLASLLDSRSDVAHRQLLAETAALTAFADRAESLLPGIAAPWWPSMRDTVRAAEKNSSRPQPQPYTRTPISLTR
jgi:hypothetical protein